LVGGGCGSTLGGSPRGDTIAFTRQKDGNFGIGVMKPDGAGERMLVDGFHNEGPTFSPNGLFVMFFSDPGGQSGAKIHMADIFGHAEFTVPTPDYASDPSWGPLLN
jgi:TolB protein